MYPDKGWSSDQMKEDLLFEFSQVKSIDNWEIVNDVVMGGVSKSEFVISEDSCAVFRGTVSLENYGGFALVRSGRQKYDLTDFDGIVLVVRGDGKTYRLRLETDNTRRGVGYQLAFETIANEWRTVKIPFKKLEASFRGRKVTDAPEFDSSRIRRLGLIISDKQAGPFRLEIEGISAYAEARKR
jgi:monofunctional biosynthetic peptidoglycan transglycosylase